MKAFHCPYCQLNYAKLETEDNNSDTYYICPGCRCSETELVEVQDVPREQLYCLSFFGVVNLVTRMPPPVFSKPVTITKKRSDAERYFTNAFYQAKIEDAGLDEYFRTGNEQDYFRGIQNYLNNRRA